MNLILHIGTAKTGSSSIQTFLFENKIQLNKFGYEYIHTEGRVDNRDIAVAFMKRSKSDEYTKSYKIEGEIIRFEFSEHFKKKLTDKILSLKDQGIHTCVISSEHLSSRINKTDELDSFKLYLQEIFDDIRIIAYVRDQRKKFPSSYSTRIKSGGTLTFNKAFNDYFNSSNDFYHAYFQLWGDFFGQESIRLQLFDRKHLLNGDLLQDFLILSGIEIDHKELKDLRSELNTSLSKNACNILRIMNLFLPKSNLKSTKIRGLLIKVLNYLPGKPWTLSPEQSELLKQKYQTSNEALRKHYFPSKQSLFDD